jgi:hypothetical protein
MSLPPAGLRRRPGGSLHIPGRAIPLRAADGHDLPNDCERINRLGQVCSGVFGSLGVASQRAVHSDRMDRSSTLFHDALIIQSRRWQCLYRKSRRDRPFSIRTRYTRTAIGKSVRAPCRGHLSPPGTGDVLAPHQSRDSHNTGPGFQGDEPCNIAGVTTRSRPDRYVQIFPLRVKSRVRERRPWQPCRVARSSCVLTLKSVRSWSSHTGAICARLTVSGLLAFV